MTEKQIKPEFSNLQLPGEIWRPILGYEDLYAVSNYGRIKSLTFHSNHRFFPKERLRRLMITQRGYCRVSLCKEHKVKVFFVHRLVAAAFLPPPPTNQHTQINHIDGIQGNNHVSNLEWVTPEGNIAHAHSFNLFCKGDRAWQRHKPERIAKGERHGRAKISEGTVREIKSLIAQGVICRLIAEKLNVSFSSVADIKSGRSWKHVTL